MNRGMNRGINLWSTLERAARLHPEVVGVVDGERSLTYRAVRARAASLAAYFLQRGLLPGDRISILAWNSREYLETYYAAAGAGLVLNPLNVRLAAVEQVEILRDAGARLLVAQAGFAELVEAIRGSETPLEDVLGIAPVPAEQAGRAYEREIERGLAGASTFEPAARGGDDLAHLYYTSGTTGRPKGVMLTHRNILVHALGAVGELSLSGEDAWAHIAPMFHLADAWATFAITQVGGRHVMLPRFEAEAALDLLERERITITNLVPTMLKRMVEHASAPRRDYKHLRAILSGGAAIAPELVRAIVDVFGCEYVQTYGLTETSPYLTLSLLKAHLRALSAEAQLAYKCKTGRPFATVELRVVDDHGREVPPDETSVGEIRVRGETVTPGYWNRPEETAAAFEDGWFKTGDLAVIDREGYVTIVDRKKDVIQTGAEKVYSTEVEHALCAHPAVLEAAVFGVPDETWGESVRAAVVLRPGAEVGAAELIAFCRTRLAGYKCPRAVEFRFELPRTASGKIRKRALRGF